MKRLMKLVVLISFILTVVNSSIAYSFELGGGHGGAYDSEAYWPAQSNTTNLSNFPGIKDPFLKFKFKPTGSIIGSLVVGRDGVVYFCTSNEKLYAVNPNGTEKWSVPCGYVWDGAPVIGEGGMIYVASSEGVIAFNSDGTREWVYEQTEGKGSLVSYMAINIDGNLLITEINSGINCWGEICDFYYITCIDKTNGELKWTYHKEVKQADGKDITNKASCAVSSDGTIYVKLGNTMVALSKYGGEKWTKHVISGGFLSKYYSKITIDNAGNVYVSNYDPEYTGSIACFTPDGNLKWLTVGPNNDFQGQCAIGADGTIYAVTGWVNIDYKNPLNPPEYREGGLFTLNPSTGEATEIYHDENGIFNSPIITSDGIIYLDDGVAVNSSGIKLWDVDGYDRPVIGKDGTLYYKYYINGRSYLYGYVDRMAGSVECSHNTYTVKEDANAVTIAVIRKGGSDGKISVDYETIDGTAEASVDYTADSGTLVFENEETQKYINISIENDRVHTGDRDFTIQLKNPSGGGSLGGNSSSTVAIIEDDPVDVDSPIVESLIPSNNEEDVSIESDVVVTFPEYIIQGDFFEQITLLKGSTEIDCTCTISEKDLIIKPSEVLENDIAYTVVIPADAVRDESNNSLLTDFTSSFVTESITFTGGNGTPSNPYLVSTPESLNEIRYYPDRYFRVTADIDMSNATGEGGKYYNEGEGWEPIGDFRGVFDGNNHRISGIKINRVHEMRVGLFGRNRGSILNLGLVAGEIITESDSKAYLGGIAGENNGLIFNCYNTCLVDHITTTVLKYPNNYCTGGIAGYNNGVIEHSYNEGDISSTGGYYGGPSGIGGITGYNRGTIKGCYNTNNLNNISFKAYYTSQVGGIAGINGMIIEDCYNTANISNSCDSGPIVGMCNGYYNESIISNSYSLGIGITERSPEDIRKSGIAYCTYESNTIENSYYFKSSDDVVDIGLKSAFSPTTFINVNACTEEELKHQETFTGFDFDNVWDIDEGNSYPTLKPVVHPQGISLDTDALTLSKDGTYNLTAVITPQNTTNKNLIWITSDDSVVTISNGMITAKDFGTTTVTVTTQDGALCEICTVTVASSEKEITTFTLADQTGLATIGDGTIEIEVAYGTNVTSLESTIGISENATISPLIGEVQDFTNPITYIVTAEDSSTKEWKIIVTVEAPPEDTTPPIVTDDTSGGRSSGSSRNNTKESENISLEENDKILKEALENEENAVLSLKDTKEAKAQITPQFVKKLGKKNKLLIVENEGIRLGFSPGVLSTEELNQATENNEAKLELGAKKVTEEEKQEVLQRAEVGESTGLFHIGGRIFDLTAQIVDNMGNKTKIKSFNDPVAVTIDLSDMNLTDEDITNLTGIRYKKDVDGNIVPVKLGGVYDPDTKTFTFYTDKFSLYGIAKADKLTKIRLAIDKLESEVNEKEITNDVAPTIINNRTMVPVRFIAENIGAKVTWIGEDRKVIIELDDKKLELIIDKTIEGFDTPATIVNDRTLVPIRYIAEMLDSNVMWFPDTREVYIVR